MASSRLPKVRDMDAPPEEEEGVYFYGAGAFRPAGPQELAVTEDAGSAQAVASTQPVAAGPASGSGGTAKPVAKMSWSKVVASSAPTQPPELPAEFLAAAAEAARMVQAAEAARAAATASTAVPTLAGPTASLCAFFSARGGCRSGERCRFRHVLQLPWAVQYFEEEMKRAQEEDDASAAAAKASDSGGGGGGGGSRAGGADAAASASDADFEAESESWQAKAVAARTALLDGAIAAGVVSTAEEGEVALQAAERNMSEGVDCGICLEDITSVPGRRFGLLTHCSHAFCLDCIRQWRARIDLPKETVRSCPLCRKVSYFVVPCDRYIADPGRKAMVNAQYVEEKSGIPCRNWDYGRGTCAFGGSCHFRHLMPDGTPAVVPKSFAFRMDSEGNVFGVGKGYKLNQFL